MSLSEVGVAAAGAGMGQRPDGLVGSRGVLAKLSPHVCQSARLRWGSLALHTSLMGTPALCPDTAAVRASCFPSGYEEERLVLPSLMSARWLRSPLKSGSSAWRSTASPALSSLSCGWQSAARSPAAPRVPGAAGSSPPAAWLWVEPHGPVTKGRDRGRRVSAPSCALPWELPSLRLTRSEVTYVAREGK